MNIVFYLLVVLLAVSLWFCCRWIFNRLGREIKDMKNEIIDIMKENNKNE